MEKKETKKREKRLRLNEIIPDDAIRNEMLSRLYKGDPILGEKGVFTNLLQSFVNAALEGEMDNFLQEAKDDSSDNRRNGHTSKSLRSTAGPLSIQTPRDRSGDHEPVIVKKRERELGTGLDEIILSLYARGQSVEDVRFQLHQIYGLEISTGAISAVTDQALGVVKSGTFKGFESDWETSKSKTGFNSLLKNATDPVGKENRLTYIKRESADGGNLDQKKNLDLHKIYGASGYAMDRNEAGNYVWGAALAKFGISTSDALFLANAGTLYLETINRPNKQGYGWSQWEIAYRLSKARLDEPDDQRAIELGSVKIWGFRLSK